jgi:itaconyl-CoA hydratase
MVKTLPQNPRSARRAALLALAFDCNCSGHRVMPSQDWAAEPASGTSEYIGVIMGNYLEDFKPGQTFKHWPGRTITDFDNTWFTLMTLNSNPLHFDAAYAAKSQHGKCLVNGLLVIALVTGMSVKDISETAIANLEYESIRHVAPTFNGDTLYAETTVLEVRPSKSKPDRGVVYVETRGLNQNGEQVLTLRRKVLIPRRPH